MSMAKQLLAGDPCTQLVGSTCGSMTASSGCACVKAGDEIVRLRAENRELRENATRLLEAADSAKQHLTDMVAVAVAPLRAEVEALKSTPPDKREDLRCVISDLIDQGKANLADADRYRWIAGNGGCPFAETDSAWDGPDQLARAIDIEWKRERDYEEFRARAAQGGKT